MFSVMFGTEKETTFYGIPSVYSLFHWRYVLTAKRKRDEPIYFIFYFKKFRYLTKKPKWKSVFRIKCYFDDWEINQLVYFYPTFILLYGLFTFSYENVNPESTFFGRERKFRYGQRPSTQFFLITFFSFLKKLGKWILLVKP